MNAFNLKREWRRSRFATPLDSLSLLRGLFVQSVYSGAVHIRRRGFFLRIFPRGLTGDQMVTIMEVTKRSPAAYMEDTMENTTRDRILDEALILFAEKGYKGANLRDLVFDKGIGQFKICNTLHGFGTNIIGHKDSSVFLKIQDYFISFC